MIENQKEIVITDEEGGVVHLPIATTESPGIASFDERFFLVTEDGKVESRALGKAATIAIGTVTTGPPGSEASVTNVGTPSEVILNFVIPRGEKGDPGAGGGVVEITSPEKGKIKIEYADKQPQVLEVGLTQEQETVINDAVSIANSAKGLAESLDLKKQNKILVTDTLPPDAEDGDIVFFLIS